MSLALVEIRNGLPKIILTSNEENVLLKYVKNNYKMVDLVQLEKNWSITIEWGYSITILTVPSPTDEQLAEFRENYHSPEKRFVPYDH